jgi:cation diffusion facilitator family transporter
MPLLNIIILKSILQCNKLAKASGGEKLDRFRITKKVAVMGILANIFLLVSKLTVGFISSSQSMIADGFNSAGDVFASAMTYAGSTISGRPKDQTHPYGHGKAEYIFSMIISFSLVLVAYKVFRSSFDAIIHRSSFQFSWWLIAVASATIAIKLTLFIVTKKLGKQQNNLLITANSEDHRNDVFVTSSTLLGILMGYAGIHWADGIAGIGISIWIAYTGFRIFSCAYHVLMDTNIDQVLKADIMKAVESIDGVDHIDDIAAKPVGVNYILIVKISVHGHLTVNESHSIAARVREKLRSFKKISDAVVHVNPV